MAKHKGGRPTTYTPAIAQQVCEGLTEGNGIVRVCRKLEIGVSTVFQWLEAHPEFAEKYARARDVQAEHFASEIVDIADDSASDTVTRYREDGSEYQAVDHDHINRSRLRVDARKWYASKVAPKKWGDVQKLEVSGSLDITTAIAAGRKRVEEACS